MGMVVANHQRIVADAQPLAHRLKLRRRHQMHPSGIGVFLEIIRHGRRAGDVSAVIGGVHIAIHHHQVGVAQMRRQPVGFNQIFGMGIILVRHHRLLCGAAAGIRVRECRPVALLQCRL